MKLNNVFSALVLASVWLLLERRPTRGVVWDWG